MLENLKQSLPDYAKDIKLNLSSVLSETGSSDLNKKQIAMTALGAAYATRMKDVIFAIKEWAQKDLSTDDINAVKGAATIMAMNNIYYRFTHAMIDQSYNTMPVNLRMNVMAKVGNDKINFELASLAISALNGCAKCLNAHANALEKNGITKKAIQSAVRIASVINAVAQGLEII